MRKIRSVVLTLALFLILMPIARAECDVAEANKLNSMAVNVRHNYEVIEKEIEKDPDYNTPDGVTEEEANEYIYKKSYFRISINNITQELYVVITNQNTKETKTLRYEDAVNGTISFDEAVTVDIVDYTVDIFASNSTNCAARKLRTFYITTPKYNNLSEYAMCDGIEEFYLCHEYLAVETSVSDFVNLTQQYRDGKIKEDGSINDKNDGKNKGIFGFIKDHKGTVIITSVVVIAIGGLVTVIIVKKQRSRIV